jgi:hypothetical protein
MKCDINLSSVQILLKATHFCFCKMEISLFSVNLMLQSIIADVIPERSDISSFKNNKLNDVRKSLEVGKKQNNFRYFRQFAFPLRKTVRGRRDLNTVQPTENSSFLSVNEIKLTVSNHIRKSMLIIR